MAAPNFLSSIFNFFNRKGETIIYAPQINAAGIAAQAVYNKTNAETQIRDGYLTNSEVYSIVEMIAKKAAAIPFDVVDKEGEKIDNHPLKLLLKYPNQIQDEYDLKKSIYAFMMLTGNAYCYTPNSVKGIPLEIWGMPTQNTSPIVNIDSFPHRVLGYEFNMIDYKILEFNEVLHFKMFNPVINSSADEVVGISPLQAAAKILQRSSDETDYSVAAFQNSGISGIVANKSVTNITSEQLAQLKRDFYTEATGTKNARKLLFQNGEIYYIPIGLSPVEMNVINSEVRTFKRLCNIYGVSDVLFNNGESSTESNVKEMRKSMYSNAIMPMVEQVVSNMNRQLASMYKDGVQIKANYSEIQELQEDLKKVADMYAALPFVRPNDVFEAMGYQRLDDPLMEKVYAKTGYVGLDELNINTGDI